MKLLILIKILFIFCLFSFTFGCFSGLQFTCSAYSQISNKTILSQNNNKIDLINFYRSRYKIEGPYSKIIDNQGEGFDSLYGLRNMRTILYGIAYRGGANNYFHRTNPRKNKNPLPDDALINLCKEGFSYAIYLYNHNFETADTIKFCQSCLNSDNCRQNKFIYSQNSLSTPEDIYKILKLIHTIINTDTLGPVYLHCWNGWHQSGLISAIILKQFCNYNTHDVINYWKINTDGHKLKEHQYIEKMISNFSPYPDLVISKEMKKTICPCLTKKPYLQDENYTVYLGENVIMKNIFFQPNDSQLLPESNPELLKLVQFLKRNPEISIEISAHIYNLGSPDYNLKLTEARAKTLYDFLVQNNIDSNRLVYKGYGSTKPINSNETVEDKINNRRIEFSINAISKDIYFQPNSDLIETNSKKFLNHLFSSIPPNLPVQVEIIFASGITETQLSDTSQTNTDASCVELTINRMLTIYNYLLERGIPKNQINMLKSPSEEGKANISNENKGIKIILRVFFT